MTDKVAKVYDAVLELVNRQNNPLKITVSEIADKCGIGKGTVYEYFKSKDDIFIMTFNHFIGLVIKDIESIDKDTFKDMFYAYYEQLEKMHKKCNAAYLTIMFGDARFIVNEEIADKINNMIKPLNECMTAFIIKMIAKGIEEDIIGKAINEFDVCFGCMGIVTTVFTMLSPLGETIFKNKELVSAESCYNSFVKLLQ